MGLDMYLTARIYVSDYEHTKELEPETYKKAQDIKALFPNIPTEGGSIYISLPVGYWRKANHIHKWFVDNVQEGEDNCAEYYVSIENLKELKEACESTIAYLDTLEKEYNKEYPDYYEFKNVDENAIPLQTTSGFFFGNTEYDSYVYADTVYTLEKINQILENPSNIQIYYQSSW